MGIISFISSSLQYVRWSDVLVEGQTKGIQSNNDNSGSMNGRSQQFGKDIVHTCNGGWLVGWLVGWQVGWLAGWL